MAMDRNAPCTQHIAKCQGKTKTESRVHEPTCCDGFGWPVHFPIEVLSDSRGAFLKDQSLEAALQAPPVQCSEYRGP